MTLYCMIVLLVKFTLFVAFLVLISAIYLVNKDYYCKNVCAVYTTLRGDRSPIEVVKRQGIKG